jgi:hypothetical protein
MSFLTMTNELSTPKILICPSDPARTQKVDSWEQFAALGGSYELALSRYFRGDSNRSLCPLSFPQQRVSRRWERDATAA